MDLGSNLSCTQRNTKAEKQVAFCIGDHTVSYTHLGFVYVKESEELINKVKELSVNELEKCLGMGVIEWYVLKGSIKKNVENYIYEKTKRRPTIIPIIMET